MNLLAELKSRFEQALAGLVDDQAELLEMIRPAQDAKFGDYQANLAMPLGKRLGKPPREVAAMLVERLRVDDLCEPPEIAGPGFINLRLRADRLVEQVTAALADKRLGVAAVDEPKTYVIDYSAPNVAKPMHVGHIRSTVIGDALYRTLGFLGHRTISDNHIGDWGTQFGMIIYGWKHFRDVAAYGQDQVGELARLYRRVNEQVAEHPDIREQVLAETAKLHAGEAENLQLWKEFLPPCLEDIERIYRRLGVRFDHTLGESFYHDRLAAVVDDLQARGIATESDRAICIFSEGSDVPMIVRKQDGAFLYGTTDLATIQYRMETWHPDAILYVVDHRQSLHFEHLFAAARRWGYDRVELRHISFGTVLGEDKRPYKTRSGDTVGLGGLLDEAIRRALEVVSANDDAKPDGPELSPDERQQIAKVVGIAALKYADLSQNRTSDYVFSYDKMLALNGNTATYMQYAYARVRSILARGGVDEQTLATSKGKIVLDAPAERSLALGLLGFSEALASTVADYRPNLLTGYLFDLANRFSTFYQQCPVLKAETESLRTSRLKLALLTARVLEQGLNLLGIDVVEKM